MLIIYWGDRMVITNAIFTELTDDELSLYNECKKRTSGLHSAVTIYEYPDKVRYCMEPFPCNFLDHKLLKQPDDLMKLCEEFKNLLENTETGEREILNFIRDSRAYHLIGAVQKRNYNFGHHGTYIFPEFKLGTSYQVDYLILGKNSDGFYFVFVELESPYGKITIADGDEGEVIRKGLNQIDDWDRWIQANFASMAESFEKYKHSHHDLTKEFYKFDKTRINYVVVVGRRSDYNEKLRWKRRNLLENKKIVLMHYDNLYDYAISVIGENTY